MGRRTKSPGPKEFYVQKLRTKMMLLLLTNRVWSTNNLCLKEKQHTEFYVQVLKRLLKWVLRVKLKVRHKESWALLHDNVLAHLLILTLKHFLAYHGTLISLVIWLPYQLFLFSLPWTPTSKHKHFRMSRISRKKMTTELIFLLDTFKDCFEQWWEEHENVLQRRLN